MKTRTFLFQAVMLISLAVVPAVRVLGIAPSPFSEKVEFSAQLTAYGASGTPAMTATDEMGSPSATPTVNAGESATNLAYFRPGKQYNVSFSATVLGSWNSSTSQYDYNVSYQASFTAPRGFLVYVNGYRTDLWTQSFTTHGVVSSIPVSNSCLVEIRSALGSERLDAGAFTGINLGQSVSWGVGLGGTRNGHSAGRIIFTEKDFTTGPGLRDRLYYDSPANNGQIFPYYDGSSSNRVRQIKTPQTLVDLIDDTGSTPGYTMNFYAFDSSQWTGGGASQYVPKSGGSAPTPWRTIHVSAPTTGTQLIITLTEGTTTRVSTLTLSGGPVSSGTFVWTLLEGDSSTTTRSTIHTSTHNVDGTRDDVVEVHTGGTGGTLVSKVKFHYVNQPWGEELSQKTVDPSGDNITTTFAYFTTSADLGNYGQIQSITDSTGKWTYYSYYNDYNRRGQVSLECHPFNNSSYSSTVLTSGDSLAYDYNADFGGRYTSEASRQNDAGGTEVALRTAAAPDLTGVRDSQPFGTYATKVYASTSVYQTTTAEIASSTSGNADYFGQPFSVKRPDQSQDSYVYLFGTYSGTTFTESSGTIPDTAYFETIIWHGSSSTSVGNTLSSYTATATHTVSSLNLIANKSTKDVIIRDSAGNVVRKETWVCTGSGTYSSTPVFSEDLAYDGAGRLTDDTTNNGGYTKNTYANGLLTSTKGPTGIETDFTSYDPLGRVLVASKVSGPTTTNTYDAIGHLLSKTVSASGFGETLASSWTYYNAGTLHTETLPGLTATTYTYVYGVSGEAWSSTATAPDGGTTIKTYQLDGKLASTTGTALVPQYYTYGASSTGRSVQVNSGTSSSTRKQTSWTDWAGRQLQTEKAGFSQSSRSDLYEKDIYDATTGLLNETRHTDNADANVLAPTYFKYDTLGQMTESGMDIDGSSSLSLTSTDRITDQDVSYYYDGTSW